MPLARQRINRPASTPSPGVSQAAAPARLADDPAVPATSPVHRLQAGLTELTSPPDLFAEELYPGWLRVAFPVVSSVLLWGTILWGTSRFV
jgi:hypothetical protein